MAPKRLTNLAKHGLDFADLSLDFFQGAYVEPAQGGRFKAVGRLVVAVVFKLLGSEALSVISLRRANRKERTF